MADIDAADATAARSPDDIPHHAMCLGKAVAVRALVDLNGAPRPVCASARVPRANAVQHAAQDEGANDSASSDAHVARPTDDVPSMPIDNVAGAYPDHRVGRTPAHGKVPTTTRASRWAYTQARHFEQRLDRLQGKGDERVTDDIIDAVAAWHADHDMASSDDVTPRTVTRALASLGAKHLYDAYVHIWCRVTGKSAPMDPAGKDRCLLMFASIQAPCAKWKARVDPARTGSLPCDYVLYKFCQLLGWCEPIAFLSLPRLHSRLAALEAIWNGICQDLGWQYIPAPAALRSPASMPSHRPPSPSMAPDHAHHLFRLVPSGTSLDGTTQALARVHLVDE
ncbi:Poxvirus Late Transcription Factor VLTF3 like protein [Pandoravirus dulcis]|uniref:Poxvirus Late Transcription Factor VLTF3 like protein n=1 Tax=Pandoravirus dulcis TaxID=1349409 RepID=S4VXQ2_9VIRU|nr:Poxvirus Late Transcription Factor VLTF3 like protein [Pandoravirus dulcis]AGO82846.1 Poxvirus Late Transcription Factor VLTF3 like protein [Pandoravirus dulcis]